MPNQSPSFTNPKASVISLLMLGVLLITFWSMLDMVLLTFILTFIFYHLLQFVQKKLQQLLPFQIHHAIVTLGLYVVFLGLLALVSYVAVPIVVVQLTELSKIFTNFDMDTLFDALGPTLYNLISDIEFNKYVGQAGVSMASYATKVGGFGLKIFLSLLLSLLLLLEKEDIAKFGRKLADSKVSFIYDYVMYFGSNFIKTFGEVMKVQVLIAFINALASMLFLTLMGFPQIIGLGIMIFILGLIPVAGVIISLIPLLIIGFNIGGITKVIGVIVMISSIHALEAYVLNPKLMSDKTHLPVCFVFIILLVGEHYLGVWGLLIGVPIFVFLMTILGVDYGKR